jgi:hypothetical protein
MGQHRVIDHDHLVHPPTAGTAHCAHCTHCADCAPCEGCAHPVTRHRSTSRGVNQVGQDPAQFEGGPIGARVHLGRTGQREDQLVERLLDQQVLA